MGPKTARRVGSLLPHCKRLQNVLGMPIYWRRSAALTKRLMAQGTCPFHPNAWESAMHSINKHMNNKSRIWQPLATETLAPSGLQRTVALTSAGC